MATNIFISYSQKDEASASEVETALADLTSQDIVRLFIDRQLGAGDRWRRKIMRALDRMDVAILLISDHFLASDFIRNVELPAIRRHARNRQVMVVPLLLEECRLEIPRWIFAHQSPVDIKTPLAALDEPTRADALYRAAEQIRLFSFRDDFLRRFLRRRILNWRYSVPVGITSALLALVATLAAWRFLQPGEVQALSWTTPAGFCRAENATSSVQLFEHGWLLANFERDEFYAIGKKDGRAVEWVRINASGFTKGVEFACEGVPSGERLRLGFRWFYCGSREAGRVAALLGAPLTGEVRVFAQYQPWIGGLFVYGLPGTVQGVEADHFQVLNGVMMAGAGGASPAAAGRGRFFGHTTETADRDEYCTAAWYPARAGRPTHPMQDGILESGVCERLVPSDFYLAPRLQCSIDGYDDSLFRPVADGAAMMGRALSGRAD